MFRRVANRWFLPPIRCQIRQSDQCRVPRFRQPQKKRRVGRLAWPPVEDYIYVGYQARDSAPEDWLMELNFYSALGPQQGPQVGWECWDSTDINKGAGGDSIYMEWKKG